MALPTYFGSSSNPADNGTANEPATLAVTPPASTVAGDLVFLIGLNGAATTGQMTISATGGQTWNAAGETAANTQCAAVWWCEYNGTWSADPSIAFAAQAGTLPVTAVMHVFRPGSASETWTVDIAYSGAGFSAPGVTAFAVPLAGPTTTQNNVVSFAGWLSSDDNTWGSAYVHDVDQQTGTTGTAATAGVAGGTAGSGQTNPAQAVGQSFTTGSNGFNLDSILLNPTKIGSPTDDFYIELYSTSITGTLLATSDTVGGGSITTNTDVVFNFASKPALSSGTQYFFQVLRSGARDASNYIVPRFSTASVLANGGLYSKTNNAWSSESTTNDLRFKITPEDEIWVTTGLDQYRNVAGVDHSGAFAHCIQATAGPTFNVSRQQLTVGGDAGVGFTISIYSAAAAAGIAHDADSNSSYQAAASSYSWNHTCTGTDRYLTVGIAMLSLAQTVSGITYNSVAMSLLGVQASVTGAARVELWGLIAPSTGTNSIAVTLTGAIASAGVASSYTGVHQTSPVEAFNSAQATNVGAADATVNVTTVADNDWVVDIVCSDDTAITVGAGQTQAGNVTGAGGSGAMSYEGPKTPAGSVTMSWANVAALATWAIGAIGLRPIAATNLGFIPKVIWF